MINDHSADSNAMPHEPVMIRFVSEATGHTYDADMVDHLADMLLIFYAGGGAAIGTITGVCIGAGVFLQSTDIGNVIETLPLCGLVGALAGCLLVFTVLNLRGLIRWDRFQIKRTYKLKKQ